MSETQFRKQNNSAHVGGVGTPKTNGLNVVLIWSLLYPHHDDDVILYRYLYIDIQEYYNIVPSTYNIIIILYY